MTHVLNNDKDSRFIQKHSAAKRLPTRQLMDVVPRLKFLNPITAFTHSYGFPHLDHLQPKETTYTEPVQGLNLNHQSTVGLEAEMPVTTVTTP